MPVEPKLGTLVDVAIKGVRVVGHPSALLVRIADEHGATYDMPPQAAFTRSDHPNPIDAVTLRERVGNALCAIDNMVDEQMLDPWAALAIRKQLDPNPRHWPPQPGDVWDDGFPFGPSLWFAQAVLGDSDAAIFMVPVEGSADRRDRITPDALLANSAELGLAYRSKKGDNA